MFLYHQKLYDNKVFKIFIKEVCCSGVSLCAPSRLPSGEEGLSGQAGNKSYVLNPIPEIGDR